MEISRRKSSDKDELKKMAKKKLMERRMLKEKRTPWNKTGVRLQQRGRSDEWEKWFKLNERKRLIKESKEDVDSFVKSIIEKFSGWKDRMDETDVWNDVHDMIEEKFVYGNEDDSWELIKRYSDISDWDMPDFCYPEEAVEKLEDEIFEELGCVGLEEDCGTKKAKDSLKNEKCDDSEKAIKESTRRKLRNKLNEKKNITEDELDKEIEDLMESNLFRFSKLYK